MWSMPALAWEGRQGAAAARVSSRTTVPLSRSKNEFPPQLLGSPTGGPPLAAFLNPPSSFPTQQMGNQPTYPQVQDSLLKRRSHTFSCKYQAAYSVCLYGTLTPALGSLSNGLESTTFSQIGDPPPPPRPSWNHPFWSPVGLWKVVPKSLSSSLGILVPGTNIPHWGNLGGAVPHCTQHPQFENRP